MVVTFCGHSTYVKKLEDEEKVLSILENVLRNECAEFYLGEYGNFDSFAYGCSKKFKERHPTTKLIFITPYIGDHYQKNGAEYQADRFDLVLYPGIENVPPKYAITHRNSWMATQADIVIAYVTHKYGGAYTMYRYAKGKKKKVYNIAEEGVE